MIALVLAAALTASPQVRRMHVLASMAPGRCVSTAELRTSAGGVALEVSETTIRSDAQWLVDQAYPVTKGGTASRILWCR